MRFATDLVSILDSTLEVGVGTGIPLMHPGEALETDLLLCAFLGLVLGAQSVVDGAVNNLVAGLDTKLSFESVVLVAEGTLPILLLVLLDLVWNGLLLGFLAATPVPWLAGLSSSSESLAVPVTPKRLSFFAALSPLGRSSRSQGVF